MKHTFRLVCLVLVGASLVASCFKKGNPTPPVPMLDKNTTALTSGSWKLTLWEVKQDDSTWLSLPLTSYQKLLVNTYNTDHTYIGTSASNLGGTSTFNGTWKFLNNETQIEVDGADGSITTTTIAILNSTQLQPQAHLGPYPLPDAHGNITTYHGVRFTWGH